MSEIFVQIPSYRDEELCRTLSDLYSKARNPNQLHTCVAWQHDEREFIDPKIRALPNLEIIDIPHTKSLGCNWARSLTQKKWSGEPYTLLIDSHMRFVQNWDELVLSMYDNLKVAGVERPILTGYFPPYVPNDDPEKRMNLPLKIYPMGRENGVLVRLTGLPIPFHRALDHPCEADFVSLHFLFAEGCFNEKIPMDPDIYFFGDEVLISARTHTNGYDLFHPHQVVGWHCYDRASRVAHWSDNASWIEQNRMSLRRTRRILEGKDSSVFSLGSERKLSDFEDKAMVELIERG